MCWVDPWSADGTVGISLSAAIAGTVVKESDVDCSTIVGKDSTLSPFRDKSTGSSISILSTDLVKDVNWEVNANSFLFDELVSNVWYS